MPATGITKCYIAKQVLDIVGSINYDTPKYYQNIQELDIKPKQNTDNAYAENRMIDQETLFDSAAITANWYDLTVQQRAEILGQNLSAEGGTYAALGDIAPYVAVLYKSPLTGGQGNRYGVIYKGQFTLPDDTMKGLEGKPDLGQTPKLTGNFQSTNYVVKVADPNSGNMIEKHIWEYHIDTTEDLDSEWFANVYIPGADIIAPTVTTLPLDAAIGVLTSANLTFTFNKAMSLNTINDSNILLMKADGTPIETVLSLDSTGKIATLNPTSDLATGSYIAICTKNVKSIFGIAVASATIVNFTV